MGKKSKSKKKNDCVIEMEELSPQKNREKGDEEEKKALLGVEELKENLPDPMIETAWINCIASPKEPKFVKEMSEEELLGKLANARKSLFRNFEILETRINYFVDQLIYPRRDCEPSTSKSEEEQVRELMKNTIGAMNWVEELERKVRDPSMVIPNKSDILKEYEGEKEYFQTLIMSYEEGFALKYKHSEDLNVDIEENPCQSHSKDPLVLNASIKELRRLVEYAKFRKSEIEKQEEDVENDPTKQEKSLYKKSHRYEMTVLKVRIEFYEKELEDTYKQAKKFKIDIDEPREDDWIKPEILKAEILELRESFRRVTEKFAALEFGEEQNKKRKSSDWIPSDKQKCLRRLKTAKDITENTIDEFEIALAYKQAAFLKIEFCNEEIPESSQSAPSMS